MKYLILIALFLGAGCAHQTPVPVPVPVRPNAVMWVETIPLTGLMVTATPALDGQHVFAPVEVMADGHNTFRLFVAVPPGSHTLQITTIDADGVVSVEPSRTMVN